MVNWYKKILAVIYLTIVIIPPSIGQPDFTLLPVQPSNYTLHYDDLWRLNIFTQSTKNLNYYFLEVRVYRQQKEQVWKAKTHTFKIQESPFLITPDNLNKFEPIDITFADDEWYQKITEGGGLFPPGQYKVLYRLIQTTAGCTTAGELVAEESYTINVKSLYPPQPLTPSNKDTIFESVIFSWAPPFTVLRNQKINYKLKVIEVMEGQTSTQAITNNPAFFTSSEITTTQFVYPSDATPLSAGQKYAWQIVAFNSDHVIGYSPVWSFIISKSKNVTQTRPNGSFFLALSASAKPVPYEVNKNILYFKYEEKYNGFDNRLNYSLQNSSNNQEVMSGTVSPLSVHEGYNTYSLDISGLLRSNNFVLIVTNEKGANYYLHFHYKRMNNKNY